MLCYNKVFQNKKKTFYSTSIQDIEVGMVHKIKRNYTKNKDFFFNFYIILVKSSTFGTTLVLVNSSTFQLHFRQSLCHCCKVSKLIRGNALKLRATELFIRLCQKQNTFTINIEYDIFLCIWSFMITEITFFFF